MFLAGHSYIAWSLRLVIRRCFIYFCASVDSIKTMPECTIWLQNMGTWRQGGPYLFHCAWPVTLHLSSNNYHWKWRPGVAWSDPASCTRIKFWSVFISTVRHVGFYFLTGAAKPLLVSPLLKFALCLLPGAEGTWKVNKGNKILQLTLKLNKILICGLGLSLLPVPIERGRKAVDLKRLTF